MSSMSTGAPGGGAEPGQVNLSRNPADDLHPVWSSDAQRIAFISNRSGGGEIFIENSDGSGLRALTDNSETDHSPSFIYQGRLKP